MGCFYFNDLKNGSLTSDKEWTKAQSKGGESLWLCKFIKLTWVMRKERLRMSCMFYAERKFKCNPLAIYV